MMLAEMVECSVNSSWWPMVLVAILIGIVIGLIVGNWFLRPVLEEERMRRAKMLHPGTGRASWGGYVDGSTGRGEIWEVDRD